MILIVYVLEFCPGIGHELSLITTEKLKELHIEHSTLELEGEGVCSETVCVLNR